tara:strand:- start:4645 stop:5259 length:615 start_codon:yes stop_codon:yes gene_type:complete
MRNLVLDNGKITSLQISEVTGKNHGHLMRDIRKMEETWVNLGQSKFGLTSYIDSQNRAKPMYQLSKTESLYIATKFNDEARAKLILRWEELEKAQSKPMSTLDIMEQSIRMMRENQEALAEVRREVGELKAKTSTRPEYFTVVGYGNLNGVSVNIKLASRLGRAASKLCKEKGLLTDEIPDPRFGKVKMYPAQILEQVFTQVRL